MWYIYAAKFIQHILVNLVLGRKCQLVMASGETLLQKVDACNQMM